MILMIWIHIICAVNVITGISYENRVSIINYLELINLSNRSTNFNESIDTIIGLQAIQIKQQNKNPNKMMYRTEL